MSADLHIEVHGRGAPLVLLHGWAMHGGVFAPLVARLADRFELHVADLPGHGRSCDSAAGCWRCARRRRGRRGCRRW